MRKNHQKQLPLMEPTSNYSEEAELDMISKMIDSTPNITDYVLQDLNRGEAHKMDTGAEGMSADQIVRACIVKHLYGFTYEKLAFHVFDSRSLRKFCWIGFADKGFSKSALNSNIKRITKRTWQAFFYDLLGLAKAEDIEKGRKARIDCTVVESNIHNPLDSSQLWDCVRVLTRLLGKAKEEFVPRIIFTDHQRRAKRRMVGIQYAKNEKQRKPSIVRCA